jgi:Lipocalin-like domain
MDEALAPLVGSWRLVSVETIIAPSSAPTGANTGERVATFGATPTGRVVVTPEGRIMFLITRSDRAAPDTDAGRAALLNATIAYSGRVRADGPGAFITSVELSLFPEEIGGEKRRLFMIDGDRLTITRPAQPSRVTGGRIAQSTLVWTRET